MHKLYRNFRFLLIVWSLFGHEPCWANFNSIGISEINVKKSLALGRRIEIWHNKEAVAEPEKVLAGAYQEHFEVSEREYPSFGFGSGEQWIHFGVNSSLSTTDSIILESRYPLLDSVTVYQKDSSAQWSNQQLGDANAEVKPFTPFRVPNFELLVYPGNNEYYVHVQTNGSAILGLFLWRAAAFENHRFLDTILIGGMFGCLIVLLLYNAFLALSFRSRTYFYYSLFIATMVTLQISFQGLWPMLLDRPEWANFMQNRGLLLLGFAVNLLACLVAIHFLNMASLMKRSHIFYRILIGISCLMLVFGNFLSYNTFSKGTSAFVGLSSIALLISSLIAYAKGYKPAIYFFSAWFFILGSNVINALQYEGVFSLNYIVQFGILPGSVIEGILMALALAERVNFLRDQSDAEIRQLNTDLKRHVTEVEVIVEERTETIRTILDHVESGFLMIDATACVMNGYSRSCRRLLGESLRIGEKLSSILLMDRQQEQFWNMAVRQVFQNELPLDVSLSQLPKTIKRAQRFLQLDAAGVLDKSGELKSILFTIQDITPLIKKQRENQRNQRMIGILHHIDAFRQFIGSSYDAMDQLKILKDVREQRFILHTLKGNSLVFKLKAIAALIHRTEEKNYIEPRDVEDIQQQFKKFLTKNETLLGTMWKPYAPEFKVSLKQVKDLVQLVEADAAEPLTEKVRQWSKSVMAKPIRTIIQPIISNCQLTAHGLGKDVRFEVKNGELNLQSEQEEKLAEYMIHLLRNAVIHGIEEEREALGKSRVATISLEFSDWDSGLRVICQDNGKGIDRQELEQSLLQKTEIRIDQLTAMSLTELMELNSRGGYSSQTTVTLLAGRGVGIEGLFALVRDMGGTVLLESSKGVGSKFTIEVPRLQSRSDAQPPWSDHSNESVA